MMPNTAFDVAMLDFTYPEAHAWSIVPAGDDGPRRQRLDG
jgi:hypothetical protein